MSDATQKHRQFAVATPLGSDKLLFRRMQAREQLGRLFEFQLDLFSDSDRIDFNQLLGQNVTVRMERPVQRDERYFNGVVSDFTQLTSYEQRYAVYRLTLKPWLWLLTLTQSCRIFQEKKVPDIVKEIFRERGFNDFKDALSGSYRTREYCVQYRETDFDFISRLLEEEGIYYFFEHQNGKHILVLADSAASHPSVGSVPYYPEANPDQRALECIFDWTLRSQVESGQVALNDFDFKVPSKSLLSITPIQRQHAQAAYEVYDYPGEYKESSDGEHYSRARIEERQARHTTQVGRSNDRLLVTGALFTLEQFPRGDQNKEYLLTGAEYQLVSNEYETDPAAGDEPSYRCHFTVLESKQPFRPQRLTRRPVVQGPQTAIVVGPKGEEIYTDEFGRVKCQFHWDRYGQYDEKSSCWMRISQGWAGKNWGMLALPRIGQEVIVDFLEGDPDQPLITGRVYNGDNKPPYALPDEKTKSTLKSNSSKGGGGYNEIRFEDKKGSEQIFIHGEKDRDIRIKNDSREWIGNDSHLIVKNDRFEEVDNDTHLTVKGSQKEKIDADKHLAVTGDHNQEVDGSHSLKVGQDIQAKAGQNYALEASGGDIHLKAGMNVVIEAGMQLTLKAGGNFVVISPAGVAVKGTMVMLNSGGSAGSGKGSNPDAAEAPTAPIEAADGKPGSVGQPPAAPQPPKIDPQKLGSVLAQAMVKAAESGAAFSEVYN